MEGVTPDTGSEVADSEVADSEVAGDALQVPLDVSDVIKVASIPAIDPPALVPVPPGVKWDPTTAYQTDEISHIYDSKPAYVVRDASNNVTEWKDRGPLGRHLKAAGIGHTVWISTDQEFKDQPVVRWPAGSLAYLDSGTWKAETNTRSIVAVVRPSTWNLNRWLFDLTTATNAIYSEANGRWRINAGIDFDTGWGGGFAGVAGSLTGIVTPSMGVHVLVFVVGGTESKFYLDGDLKLTGDSGSATSTSIRLGSRYVGTPTSNWIGDVAFTYEIRREITAAEVTRDSKALIGTYVAGMIIHDGDSLTLGRTASPGHDYPNLMHESRSIKAPYAMRNFGVGGEKAATMLLNGAKVVDQLYDAHRPFNLICFWGGLNDIYGGGDTAVGTYTIAVAYIRDRVKVGWKVIYFTHPDAWPGTAGKQVRLDLNALIKANALGASYTVCDIAADPKLMDLTNKTYFSDGTHFTDLGYKIVEEHAVTCSNAEL